MTDAGMAMYHLYETNKDFEEYCHKCMRSYSKKLTEVLESPITQEYGKSLQRGGCNARDK